MLSLDTKNIFSVGSKHGLTKDVFRKAGKKLPAFLKQIHAREQGFYDIVDDEITVRSVMSFVKKKKGKYKNIVVLGIGGSSLGTICLQQSLKHLYEHERKYQEYPRLHVLDNIDPVLIQEIQDVIDFKKTLFIVISKSGGTPEVLSQYFYFRKLCDKKKLKVKNHFVFVTDAEKGLLRKTAEEDGIESFGIPDNVGGRFSVLTSVGLLPAALIGIDIKSLLSGAREMRDSFLSKSLAKNIPFQIASVQYQLSKKNKVMTVMMPYAQKLFRFADWYRQLLAESVGKAVDNNGKIVNVGITPVNALGATDQHSQSQLYNEGPNDKLFIFITVKHLAGRTPIPNLYPKDEKVSFLKNTSFNELIDIERQGTVMSYTKNKRPNMTIAIDKIDSYHLGQLFMLFEGSTAFLGEFFNINAFNQPGVELAKNLTKELLLKKKR